jgi:putative transposase
MPPVTGDVHAGYMDARTTPGHRALRRGRRSLVGGAYLLTTVTHDRQRVFDDPPIARTVARILGARSTWSPHRCLCWVLMPDHLHALVQLGRGEPMASLMQRIKGRTAHAVAERVSGGRLWARGYHDHALRYHEDVRACARYVVSNPLRAGLVDNVLAYPYWDAVWMNGSGDPLI